MATSRLLLGLVLTNQLLGFSAITFEKNEGCEGAGCKTVSEHKEQLLEMRSKTSNPDPPTSAAETEGSAAEVNEFAAIEAEFDKMDADNDGVVSVTEYVGFNSRAKNEETAKKKRKCPKDWGHPDIGDEVVTKHGKLTLTAENCSETVEACPAKGYGCQWKKDDGTFCALPCTCYFQQARTGDGKDQWCIGATAKCGSIDSWSDEAQVEYAQKKKERSPMNVPYPEKCGCMQPNKNTKLKNICFP